MGCIWFKEYAITISCYIHQAQYNRKDVVNIPAGSKFSRGLNNNTFEEMSSPSKAGQYDFIWRSYII